MAERLDEKEMVRFKELIMANSIQADAMAQLLIEKGFFTQAEYFAKLKQVQGSIRVKRANEDLFGQSERRQCSTSQSGVIGKQALGALPHP